MGKKKGWIKMNYFLIGLILILALNTIRLFLKTLIKRRAEVREFRIPNMLPNDFVVRVHIKEMWLPFSIMLIAAGILMVLLRNIDWVGSWYSYLLLIALTLTFVIAWFKATDWITFSAIIRNDSIKINFLNIDFKALGAPISIDDITIEKRNDGTIILYHEDLRLFPVEPTNEAYKLMVDFLQENEILESDFASQSVAREKIPVATKEKDFQQEIEVVEPEFAFQSVVEEKEVNRRKRYVTKSKLFRISIRGWTVFSMMLLAVAILDIILLGDRHDNRFNYLALFVMLILPMFLIISSLSLRGIKQIKRQESMLCFSFNEEMQKHDVRRLIALSFGRYYSNENWFIVVRFGRIVAVRRDYISSIGDAKFVWRTRFNSLFKVTIIGSDGKRIYLIGNSSGVNNLRRWFNREK